MMRALAAVAASAAALVALPVTAGAEASSRSDAAGVGTSGDTPGSFLSTPSLFGMSVGAVLWLSVALVAVVVAGVLLHRTKAAAQYAPASSERTLADVRTVDASGTAG